MTYYNEELKILYKKEIRESKGKSLIEDLKDYTVVDIETTGMNWNFCNILEISSLKIRDPYTLLV